MFVNWHQRQDLNLDRTVLETGIIPLDHADVGYGRQVSVMGRGNGVEAASGIEPELQESKS